MPTIRISTLALVMALAIGSLVVGSGAALAKGGGGGGGHNGGGSGGANHANSGGSNQGSGGSHAAKNQQRRCLGNTCEISKAIDGAASKVYNHVKFW